MSGPSGCEWHTHSIFGPCENGVGLREHLFGQPPKTTAQAIRDGAHNAHTPQKRAETGQGGATGANAGTSDGTTGNGPQTAETRGHHE